MRNGCSARAAVFKRNYFGRRLDRTLRLRAGQRLQVASQEQSHHEWFHDGNVEHDFADVAQKRIEARLDDVPDWRGRSPRRRDCADGHRYVEHEGADAMGAESLWQAERSNSRLHELESNRSDRSSAHGRAAWLRRSLQLSQSLHDAEAVVARHQRSLLDSGFAASLL